MSAPRIAMGFEAAEGDKASLKGIRFGAPKCLLKPSSRLDMDGSEGLSKSRPPYRGCAWIGIAMAARLGQARERSSVGCDVVLRSGS